MFMLDLINVPLLSACNTHCKQTKAKHTIKENESSSCPWPLSSLRLLIPPHPCMQRISSPGTETDHGSHRDSPAVDIWFPGSSPLCVHGPCLILLKGSKSRPYVHWLMCLTLHEMSLYSEAPVMTSFYLHLLHSMHSCLTGWLSQMLLLMKSTSLPLNFK